MWTELQSPQNMVSRKKMLRPSYQLLIATLGTAIEQWYMVTNKQTTQMT